MKWILDIHSKKPYPANALSNFAPHSFCLDGVPIASMGGFLQALKEPDPARQREICLLTGPEAKARGGERDWKKNGLLYWQGEAVDRFSPAYRALLTRAYDQLGQVPAFREALRATGRAILLHSIGRARRKDTCLTRREFLGQLYRLRKTLKK